MSGKRPISLPKGTIVPHHVAIICDGDRRWARARKLPVFMGHQRGFDITPEVARTSRDFGVHTLTFWAFSTENWDRSKEEIAFLMRKYEDFTDKHLREAKKNHVKIIHLGRKDRLPASLVKKIARAEKETKKNSKYVLNIALDYGGRDEILRATKRMLRENLDPKKLDEELYNRYLDTHDQPYPYPDLLIRPSGEQRTSGMFSWQLAYAEIYWLPSHFPELTAENLREAILDYSRRRRRFGGNDFVPKVKFTPEKVAKLEVSWWKAHHKREKEKLFKLLITWLKELYGLREKAAKEAIGNLFKGVDYHDKREWQKAVKMVAKVYQLIKKETNYVFTPEVAAELEVNWWKIHDELENDLDKAGLEKAFRNYYGEIYRLSELQAAKAAHFKTLATVTHDLAEESKSEKEEKKYWHLAEKYLVETYRALREVAS